MEELLSDLGLNLFLTSVMLGIFVIFVLANTTLGCIKNIGILREKFKSHLIRNTVLKVLGVVIAGLAGAIALTILPNALEIAGKTFGVGEEFKVLSTSVQTIGTCYLIICLGKACLQYGKCFLDNFKKIISSDTDQNGIPDGMSL